MEISKAAEFLRNSQVVAIPTETVYGLAANALDPIAISKIFQVKGRPSDNPLIVHVSSIEMFNSLLPENADVDIYLPIINDLWPGPLTILVPRSDKIPTSVTGGHDTVAIRMPNHPIALAIIEACGFPLAAPSANTSGRPSPTTAMHVSNDLHDKIPLIVDGGQCVRGIESTVLDALAYPPVILRPGSITLKQLQKYPGMELTRVYKKMEHGQLEETPTTPGMKYRHYTPNATVILFKSNQSKQLQRNLLKNELFKIKDNQKVGVLTSMVSSEPMHTLSDKYFQMHLGNSLSDVAHNIFDGLLSMEKEGVDVILVEGVEEEDEGLGIMNRLLKAAKIII